MHSYQFLIVAPALNLKSARQIDQAATVERAICRIGRDYMTKFFKIILLKLQREKRPIFKFLHYKYIQYFILYSTVTMNFSRRNWTQQEDIQLIKNEKKFRKHGLRKWEAVSEAMNEKKDGANEMRTSEQCKKRWEDHLDPTLDKSQWSKSNIKLLFQLHAEMGNRWAAIANHFENRTASDVKNQWHSAFRRAVRRLLKIKYPQEKNTNRIRSKKPNDLCDILFNLRQNKEQCYNLLFELSCETFKSLNLDPKGKEILNFLIAEFEEKFQESENKNSHSNQSSLDSEVHKNDDVPKNIPGISIQVPRRTEKEIDFEKSTGRDENGIDSIYSNGSGFFSPDNRKEEICDFENEEHQLLPSLLNQNAMYSDSQIMIEDKIEIIEVENNREHQSQASQQLSPEQNNSYPNFLDENSAQYQYCDKILDNNFKDFFSGESDEQD